VVGLGGSSPLRASTRPRRLEAVVFDLDGVLVDSEPVWADAERSTVARLGGAYTSTLRVALRGRGHRVGASILASAFGRDDTEAIASMLLENALSGMSRGLRPMPGAQSLLTALHGRIRLGVATNSVRAVVETALATAGLDGFDAIVAGEDVREGKPAPEPYLLACNRLRVAPSTTVAIEDSLVGVASAKAAGLFVIGLEAVAGPRLDEADRTVGSLEQVHPNDLFDEALA
jgi:HAD superfamily hydrolase (TIGR01509 family)